jgi:alkyl hydroperoxide reductase subunit AhpC
MTSDGGREAPRTGIRLLLFAPTVLWRAVLTDRRPLAWTASRFGLTTPIETDPAIGGHMSIVGKKAPEFNLDAVVGDGDFKKISLKDLQGKYVVLFFYPADFTFICPTEIQEFSRRYEEFRALNCEILGASTDSKHSHKAWIKQGLGKLNHPLLADFNKTLARDYDALIEDEGLALRATIIIDDKGIVQHASYNADLLGRSVSETLRLVQALQTGERCPVEWKPGQKTLGKPA